MKPPIFYGSTVHEPKLDLVWYCNWSKFKSNLSLPEQKYSTPTQPSSSEKLEEEPKVKTNTIR